MNKETLNKILNAATRAETSLLLLSSEIALAGIGTYALDREIAKAHKARADVLTLIDRLNKRFN